MWLSLVVLGLVAFASSSAYLTRHCITVANTTIQLELGFTSEQMGTVFAAFSLGYLLCQIPGGLLGNRFGTRAALPMLSLLWSIFTVWTSAVSSLVLMKTSRLAFGMAQAGLVPNSSQVIKDWFPIRFRGSVSAVIGVSMSIGGAVTMVLTAFLIERMHWRTVFRLYSLVGIAWAIAFWLIFRTRPEQHPLVPASDPEPTPADKPTDVEETPDTPADTFTRATVILGGLSILWLAIQSFFRAAGYNLFVTFFPEFLERGHGLSREAAGSLTFWPLFGVIIGGLIGGPLVDGLLRLTGNRWISRSGVAFVALGTTALLTFAAASAGSVQMLVLLISIGAGFSGMASPSAWAAVIDLGGRYTATFAGLMNMAGCVAGILVTPFLGRMIDRIKETDGDWNQVIFLHAAFYLIAAVSWLMIFPSRRLLRS